MAEGAPAGRVEAGAGGGVRGRALRRNARLFQANRLVSSASLIWVVMTLFLRARGLSFAGIGVLNAIGAVVSIGLEVPSGYLADRWGLRRVLLVAGVANVAAPAVLAFSHAFPGFLAAELLFSVGIAMASGTDTSLLYESLREAGAKERFRAELSRARGWSSLVLGAARFLAPLVYAVAPALPFLVTAGLQTASLGATAAYVEPRREAAASPAREDAGGEDAHGPGRVARWWWRLVWIGRSHSRFLILALVSSIGFFVYSNYSQYGGPYLEGAGITTAWMGAVFVAGSVGSYLGNLLAGRIGTWVVGPRRLPAGALAWAGALSLAVVGAGAAGRSLWAAPAAYVLVSFCSAPFMVETADAVNEAADSAHRATMLSVVSAFDDLTTVVLDPAVGVMIDAAGFAGTYVRIGAIGLLAVAGVAAALATRRR